MGRRIVILCSALLFAACFASGVEAKEGQDDKQTDQRARESFREGDRAYADKRYEDAVEAFTEAYELSKRPLMLYNIANALERLERWEEAAAKLRTYREYAPRSELRTVDARIASLTARAERQKLEMLREEQVWSTDKHRKGIKSVRGAALLSTGAAALALGGVLAVLANTQRSKIDDECTLLDGVRFCSPAADQYFRRDRAYSISADVLLGSGISLTGVGIYYLIRDRKKAKERRVRVEGSLGAKSGRFTIRGQF